MSAAVVRPAVSGSGRWLLAGAVATAAVQIAISARLPTGFTQDYCVTLTEGWLAALFLAWEGRGAYVGGARPPARALGGIAALAATFVLARAVEYSAALRLVPLFSGIGLLLAGPGVRAAWRHRRELLLLALPLVNPFPKAFRSLLEPTVVSWTAGWAFGINSALGHGITREGNVLHTAAGSLDVLVGCSGLLSISRLVVLVILLIVLFPTTGWQRVALAVSAILIGFVGNAARIAVLAFDVVIGQDAKFDYWHEGPGATIFTLASTAIAGVAWWLVLRHPGRALFDSHLYADADAEVAARVVDAREEKHGL
jgi:cyanoexosortase A